MDCDSAAAAIYANVISIIQENLRDAQERWTKNRGNLWESREEPEIAPRTQTEFQEAVTICMSFECSTPSELEDSLKKAQHSEKISSP